MASRGRSFLILLAVAAAVGGYVWFVEMKRDPFAPADDPSREKIFTIDSADIHAVRITNDAGETSTLRREGDRWTLVEAPGAEVDQAEASTILSGLTTLESTRVVDEQPPSLAEYGLETPRIAVAFTDAGGAEHALLIGNRTPTGGDLYVKRGDAPRVLLMGSWNEETFNQSRFDLRDKRVLKFARDAAGTIALTSSAGRVTLERRDGAWHLAAPVDAPADETAVDGLLSRLSSERMQSIVESPESVSTGLARPAASVAITAGPTRAVLEIGGPAGDGRVYARDSTRNLVFTVDASLADELKKTADDFRQQDQ